MMWRGLWRSLRPVVVAMLALWSAAAAVAGDLALVDPARTQIAIEGRDRGQPRPVTLTLGLSAAVPYRVAIIDEPPRLVVDLVGTAVPTSGPPSDAPLVLRWGAAPQGGARAVMTLPGPMVVDTAAMMEEGPDAVTQPAPDGGQPATARLSIRLTPVAPEDFAPRTDPLTVLRALPRPAVTAGATGGAALADGRLRVVLDPGHGGIDSGAQVDGISEAAVMLGFARELAAALQAQGIETVLTRDDDRFIPLERRTTIARAKGADLFISLHADALPAGEAAGATIYTWDERSNDRAARQLAALHDRSDMLAGLDLSNTDEDVSRALIDLARIDTQPRSGDAARHLVAQLNAAGVVMHRVPVRGAAFSVLKSPDIPSLLVELGFLTDPGDRANLFDPQWRARVAGAMAQGIRAWAADDSGLGAPVAETAPAVNLPAADPRALPPG